MPAEGCSRQTDDAIQQVVDALKNQSANAALGLVGDTNQQHLKKLMLSYECKAMRRKLDCLYSVLSSQCPADAVQLIMNYFVECLPTGCHYRYDHGPTEAVSRSTMQGDDGTLLRIGQPLSTHLNAALRPPSDSLLNDCERGTGANIDAFLTIFIVSWLFALVG